MILEVAEAGALKHPPMKSAENGQIASEMFLKRLPGDGGFGRDSFDLFGTLYEKGGGESTNTTRQIDALPGQSASIG